MKSKLIFLLCLLPWWGFAADVAFDFEAETTPAALEDSGSGTLQLVAAPYKDGSHSLQWDWTQASSVLRFDEARTLQVWRDGVIFWVYNQTPYENPLRCEFRDTDGNVQYYFDFNLNFKGWRICRIGTKYMKGDKKVRTNLKLYLTSPEGIAEGTLYIDRMSFVSDVNYQNAPDAQQPENTDLTEYNNHWAYLWEWEKQEYDIPLPEELTDENRASLEKVKAGIDAQLSKNSRINTAKTYFENAGIKQEGDFIVGTPLVMNDDVTDSDMNLATLEVMLYGLAQDAYFNNSEESKEKFLLAWDFAHDQGLAWGSSMGSNHHYGYNIREVFLGMYLMRDVLKETGRLDEAVAALSYWSGLPETRTPFNNTREGLVDCWNTLLNGRVIAAIMMDNELESYRAMQALTRWVEGSLSPTPGNVGGIKPDGCVFHHGGHYPAYAIGGLATLGDFFACINGTDFNVSSDARMSLANALFAMSAYCNFKDWPNGISGRHPLDGSISADVVETFGQLSLAGGLYNAEENIDSKLGAEYLRLGGNALKDTLGKAGITKGETPQGFYVFNHACLGVHRYQESMVSMKGYNSDVWGSEIYTSENRYGRYQSYGAVEIFNGGGTDASNVSRSGSCFVEAGWDWNRIPGTTTIHLPWTRLVSPQSSTLMARSNEDFAGASALLGEYGIFGMKLWEENAINNTYYTKDFKARKSVFAFGKRIVCLGSNINNSENTYNTETTLFQNRISSPIKKITVNGESVTAMNYSNTLQSAEPIVLSDIIGNYYRLAPNMDLQIVGGSQSSIQNNGKTASTGNFITAWLNHGAAPQDAAYEYMIMLKPTEDEIAAWTEDPQYEILQCNSNAHIIHDKASDTYGYVIYESSESLPGYLLECTEETLVLMHLIDENTMAISICDPSINLPEKVKNSDQAIKPGEPKTKTLVLPGTTWANADDNLSPELRQENGNTVLEITCLLGEPVEFTLKNPSVDIATHLSDTPQLRIHRINENQICIEGTTHSVSIYTIDGRLIFTQTGTAEQRVLQLPKSQICLIKAELPNQKTNYQLIM